MTKHHVPEYIYAVKGGTVHLAVWGRAMCNCSLKGARIYLDGKCVETRCEPCSTCFHIISKLRTESEREDSCQSTSEEQPW
jgi:hypothetical protein